MLLYVASQTLCGWCLFTPLWKPEKGMNPCSLFLTEVEGKRLAVFRQRDEMQIHSCPTAITDRTRPNPTAQTVHFSPNLGKSSRLSNTIILIIIRIKLERSSSTSFSISLVLIQSRKHAMYNYQRIWSCFSLYSVAENPVAATMKLKMMMPYWRNNKLQRNFGKEIFLRSIVRLRINLCVALKIASRWQGEIIYGLVLSVFT